MILTGLEFLYMVQVKLKQNKMKNNLLWAMFAGFILHSCVFIRMDDSIDLGDNYRFIQDTPQTIIFHTDEKYKGVGKQIIPPIILSYDFNDRYIIAKSQEVDEMTGNKKGKPLRYWIIDKSLKDQKVEPLDSIDFYNNLKLLKLKLQLKEY